MYRALRPALEQDACARLLVALEERLRPPAPPTPDLLVAIDIIVTLGVRRLPIMSPVELTGCVTACSRRLLLPGLSSALELRGDTVIAELQHTDQR